MRKLDKAEKQLSIDQRNATKQAARIRAAEQLIEDVVMEVKVVDGHIARMGEIRVLAAIDSARSLRLEPAAFSLQGALWPSYRSQLANFRKGVVELGKLLAACQASLGPLVKPDWSIGPVYASYALGIVEGGQRRLATDEEIVFNEAASVTTLMLTTVLSLKEKIEQR